jgi:hypothetical protein
MVDRLEFAVQSGARAVQDGDDGRRDTGVDQSISDCASLVSPKSLNYCVHAIVVRAGR